VEAPAGVSTKDQTYWKVLEAALEMDFKKGHQKWTMTDLSRASGVTRSLIYYYFGRSRYSLLMEAVKTIGEELFGLSAARLKLWQENRAEHSVRLSQKVAKENPHLLGFYFAHRFRDSPLGIEIRNLEKKHLMKLRQFLPQSKTQEFEDALAKVFGLVLCPHLPIAGSEAD